eukprot:TRINITY_DN23056_c0_g1_i1.p1 TRINITY_DN23056_c0_g1~~TRINITY_DN23056_c0_g1_i1.p1  ORF type:complete len:754 (+),score=213.76 TRINITY_DN23056_c0_g1_i1:49-2310(+)
MEVQERSSSPARQTFSSRPASAGPRPPSVGKNRPTSASSTNSTRRYKTQTPQFLCNAEDEETILPRPLPPGMAYVASYTSFDELVDKQILRQEEEEKVHLSVAEVSDLYHAKCLDQGLQPNRKRESRFIQLLSQNCRGMHFTLRENGLGNHSAGCIASFLADNEHFAVLDLSGNRLKDAGAIRIAELLMLNDALVHIALKSNDIGFVGAEKIAEALQSNCTVTSLDLSGLSGINRNHLGSTGAKAFGAALAVNETLAILSLGANGLGNEGLMLMSSGLEQNQTLTELDLGSNNLGWEGCTVLGPLLNSSNLRNINLERNDIRDKGAAVLAAALKMPSNAAEKIELLNLSFNNIKVQGLRWLANVFKTVPVLRVLKLDGNECGEAAEELAQTIKDNRSLTHLSMCKCEISPEAGVRIGDMLAVQATLVKLEMQDNLLGNEGAIAIAQALHANTTLRFLDIGNNKVSDAGGKALAEMIASNNTLQHLNIKQNNIKLSGNAIAEALRTNTSILELDFSYNDFSFKSYSAVATYLQKNIKAWKRQAAPRLMSQIDVLKVDEATLHGTQEEIVQEIKRREITQENLSQKKEHVKQLVAGYLGNVKKLEEEYNTISMRRAREEEAMAARSDELQREKQKQENVRRKIENKLKSEDEKINRMKKDQLKIEQEIKSYQEKNEKEFAPQLLELQLATKEQQRAKEKAKQVAEQLSKTELKVKELERRMGISKERSLSVKSTSGAASKSKSKPAKRKGSNIKG